MHSVKDSTDKGQRFRGKQKFFFKSVFCNNLSENDIRYMRLELRGEARTKIV